MFLVSFTFLESMTPLSISTANASECDLSLEMIRKQKTYKIEECLLIIMVVRLVSYSHLKNCDKKHVACEPT